MLFRSFDERRQRAREKVDAHRKLLGTLPRAVETERSDGGNGGSDS